MASIRLDRRMSLVLVLCAVGLVGGTGLRTHRLVRALVPSDAVVRPVALDSLGGGLLVSVEADGALRVRSLRDGAEALVRGEPVELGGFHVERGGAGFQRREREVLRRDWASFAPEGRCGHRRVDFGADPLGRGDGSRDRVVLPRTSEGGAAWFRLEPASDTGRDCFRDGERRAELVAERAGLVVRAGDRELRPGPGERVRVEGSFVVGADRQELEVSWPAVERAEPVRGADGRVAGYRAVAGVDLLVTSREPGPASEPPSLVLRRGEERAEAVVDEARPTVLFGRRDRLGPLGGRVLPQRAAHEELEAAVATGLRDGWIRLGPEGASVRLPRDDRGRLRDGLTRSLGGSVVALVDRWERGRAPVGLRALGGVSAGAGEADLGEGPMPLRYDGDTEAWVPSSRPRAGGVAEFVLPVVAQDGVASFSAALPLAWARGDGPWTAEPPPPAGRWADYRVQAAPGERLRVRLDSRFEDPAERPFAVAIAGAPEGTLLRPEDVRVGPRAYEGWRLRGEPAAQAARRAWNAARADRWSASAEPPEPHRERGRPWFVRVPLRAARGGLAALDLDLPGPVRDASWNGSPLVDARLPQGRTGGSLRLSVRVEPGDNLLALELELPAVGAVREAGGVRFVLDEAGAPDGLAERVADRRARRAILPADDAEPVRAPALPRLRVEAGPPALPPGTEWVVGTAAGRKERSELLVLAGPGPLLTNRYGRLDLLDAGLLWRNGPALPMGLVRRVDTDPDGPPLAGYRVAAGAPQPLRDAGDALVGPTFRTTYRPVAPGEPLGGEHLLLLGGDLHRLDHRGAPGWSFVGPEDGAAPVDLRLVVEAAGGEVSVAAEPPAVLWTRSGERVDVGSAPVPWPLGARLFAGGLRLLRPGAETESDGLAASPDRTLDADLQRAAGEALDRFFAGRPDRDGDSLALRGALLALDARTGDVLACASRERAGADPRTRVEQPCWQDAGVHPGSTFKPAVAVAALGSRDPAVRRMLDGALPDGLKRGGPRASLEGARLAPLGGREEPIRLRSRLRNHAGGLMPVDLDLEGAVRSSTNTWFGYLGVLLHRPLREGWGDAGIVSEPERLEAWPVAAVARRAGFGERIDLGDGLHGTGGRFPTVAADSDAALAARSIGQDAVTATPLGVATLLAPAVADGWMPRPRVGRDRAVLRERVLDAQASARLREALRGVVARGTAARAFSDNPERDRILGKTGSAQRIDADGSARTDGWFAGALLPPEGRDEGAVVVVCVLPGAGLGGRTAAEVVDGFLRDLVELRGWESDGLAAP